MPSFPTLRTSSSSYGRVAVNDDLDGDHEDQQLSNQNYSSSLMTTDDDGNDNDNDDDDDQNNVQHCTSPSLSGQFEIGNASDDDDDNNNHYDDAADDTDTHDEEDGHSDHDDDDDHDNDLERGPRSPHRPQQQQRQAQQPPLNYYCPLTLQMMEDPVMDGCGHCFERDAISQWLEYHALCPISRKPVPPHTLMPATALQQRIETWRHDHDRRSYPQSLDLNETTTTTSTSTSSQQQQQQHQHQQQHAYYQQQYSQLEMMLLPQERKVLTIIKARRYVRQKQQAHSRCLWSLALASALGLMITTFVAIHVYHVRLRGPL